MFMVIYTFSFFYKGFMKRNLDGRIGYCPSIWKTSKLFAMSWNNRTPQLKDNKAFSMTFEWLVSWATNKEWKLPNGCQEGMAILSYSFDLVFHYRCRSHSTFFKPITLKFQAHDSKVLCIWNLSKDKLSPSHDCSMHCVENIAMARAKKPENWATSWSYGFTLSDKTHVLGSKVS